MNDDLTDSKERLFDPAAPSTLVDRVNAKPGGPDALAGANVRRQRQAAFYRAHPRAFAFRRRLPRRWQRW